MYGCRRSIPGNWLVGYHASCESFSLGNAEGEIPAQQLRAILLINLGGLNKRNSGEGFTSHAVTLQVVLHSVWSSNFCLGTK